MAHDGLQVRVMSAGAIVTNDPDASFTAEQMIRLLALHGAPAEYDVGSAAAVIAPARAAFVTVIWE